jgi:isoleucyl-tRNA synthetase
MSTPDGANPYPTVDPRPDFPAIERAILERWKADDTFQASIDQRPEDGDTFTFNDGPPFANGLPHYGHLLTGFVKDVIPRFQTMRGNRVERVFGWDTHGLPAEMEAEKQLGVSGRKAISEYGVAKFNDFCRKSVMEYSGEWERYVTRQARWVDFDDGYKTMDATYMESVIWAFKRLYDKGLIYEENRVVPYSWAAETPLSNFELRMDDATRPRQDPALTVAFKLHPRDSDPGPMSLLAWTTTPWTLPSNLGLAVGPTITYAVMERGDEYLVLGVDVLEKYAKELEAFTQVDTLTGSDLIERTYEPLMDYFADEPNSFRVVGADWVETTEGTGIVHVAPGFGEDDQVLGKQAGLGMVVPVDLEGRFTSDVPDFAGQNVLEANGDVIRLLKEQDVVFRHETYEHNYPHCWRTNEPIIYLALPSWYVEVTSFRDRMVELNQEINWIPENVRDGRFGKWLAGARDWSISRNRFWGSPIPVWRSDDPEYPRIDVYGSIAELEADFGVKVDNLHRPYIDDLVRPNPDDPTGKSMMRRVPEVLDCWFESGSMPFAQHHYPFENTELFEKNNPVDFIVEYVNQTRGWFYTMHVLATALFDKPAFQNVICHGVVLDGDGLKLSKKLRNYPDPVEMFETLGADPLRWYLMASPILRGGDLKIAQDGSGISDVVRLVINPVWNAYSFFTLYANVDMHKAEFRTDSTQLLDRYILAKTSELLQKTTEALDDYELAVACEKFVGFLDALNNWYIRRSRPRFWAPVGGSPESVQDKKDAYDTLYTVLTTLTMVVAPLLPMISEEMYRGLTGEQSVHLTSWPELDSLPGDPALVQNMDRIREISSTALGLREEHGLRTRLPLARLLVAGANVEELDGLSELVANEVNVKSVVFTNDLTGHAEFVLKPNGRVIGRRLGKDMQSVIKAAKAGEWTRLDDGGVRVGAHDLHGDDFELALVAPEGTTSAALRSNDAIVVLDTNVTPELYAEGQARDLIRLIQQARKDDDLNVTDRISVAFDVPDEIASSVRGHQANIAEQVLATSLTAGDAGASAHEGKIDGQVVRFSIIVA